MAAPAIDYATTAIAQMNSGTTTAPLLLSANTPTTLSFVSQGGIGYDTVSNVTGRYGCRYTLSASTDFSGRKFVSWQFAANDFGRAYADDVDTLANGGWQVLFIDSVGNYSVYNWNGSDICNSNDPGGFTSSREVGSSGPVDRGNIVIIDMSRAPDASSGTLDWTDIVAVEWHSNSIVSDDILISFGRLRVFDFPIVTDGDVSNPADYEFLNAQQSNWPDDGDTTRLFDKPTLTFLGAKGLPYTVLYGMQIGDGTTATRWEQSFGQSAWFPSRDAISANITKEYYAAAYQGAGGSGQDRAILINQSASDYVAFTSHTFSGASWADNEYNITVTGSSSGTCLFATCNIEGAGIVTLAHADATECVFDRCVSVVYGSGALTDAIIRGGLTGCKGLVIPGAAGDYSALTIRFNNNTTHDIELGSGGAGAYDLSGISVASGYTLKIHNDSATNAITVTVPSGITTSTSTAGGTITVNTPPASTTINAANIPDGARYLKFINGVADASQTQVSGGSGISETLTEGVDYTAGDSIEIWVAYVSGVTAKRELTLSSQFPSGGGTITFTNSMVDCDVYNANAVDGSLVTGYTHDAVNDEIDITVASTWSILDLFAWVKYQIYAGKTAMLDFFGEIEAEDIGNYHITDNRLTVRLDYTGSGTAKESSGVRLYTLTGDGDPKKANENIDLNWRNQVFIAETGVSGLTAAESTQLAAAAAGSYEVETGYTLVESMRLQNAVLLGKASGGPDASVFRDLNDTKDRVTTTANNKGDRLTVTYDDT